MKRTIYFLVLLAVVVCTSCKKEMMGYEGMEGVYFAQQWGAACLYHLALPAVHQCGTGEITRHNNRIYR